MIALHITFGILYALLTSNIGLQSSSLALLYINSPMFAEPTAASFILTIAALLCVHAADCLCKRYFPCLAWLITLYMWISKMLTFPGAAVVLMALGYPPALFAVFTSASIMFGLSSLVLAAVIHLNITRCIR